MSIELKQAAEQVLEAFDTFGEADDFASLFALTQKMNALRDTLSQQPVSEEHLFEFWWEAHMPNATQEQAWTAFTAAVASNGVGIAAQQPATGEPVLFIHPSTFAMNNSHVGAWKPGHELPGYIPLYTHPAPSVPGFSRIAKRKLADLQEQGFTITGYAIQCGTQRGFITNGGFVGWWRSDEAPSVPDDSKRLDYLQDRGATIDLIAGVADFYPMRFRVGGLHSSANIDVRAAIDAAMLAAKEGGAV